MGAYRDIRIKQVKCLHIQDIIDIICGSNKKVPEWLVIKYFNYMRWNRKNIYKTLTQNGLIQIRSAWNSLNWNFVILFVNLNSQFIKEVLLGELVGIYRISINMSYLPQKQVLSESLIEHIFLSNKNCNPTNWDMIFKYQKLSDEFKERHKHRTSQPEVYKARVLRGI